MIVLARYGGYLGEMPQPVSAETQNSWRGFEPRLLDRVGAKI